MAVEPVIKKLIVRRFRSFPFECVEFDNPTFLVGRNGSGKSNFADVFSFLAESMSSPLQAVFDKRGGISAVRNRSSVRSYPPHLGLSLELGRVNDSLASGRYAFEVKALPNYGFEVVHEQCEAQTPDGIRYWFDRTRHFRTNVSGLKPSLDPASLCLPVVGGDRRFAPVLRTLGAMRVYAIEPGRLREMQDPDTGTVLRRDGGNAASVLQELARSGGDSVQRACEILANIVPGTTAVRPKKHGNKLSLEFSQEWGGKKTIKFEAFSMSDGTLRALGLLMAVFQIPPPSVLVIEEPESTIHPGALGAVLDLLRHASHRMQVIVTTHSPELLDAKWIEERHLRIVTWEPGASHVGPLADSSRQAMRNHLMGAGELLRSEALHAAPLFLNTQDLGQGRLFEDLE